MLRRNDTAGPEYGLRDDSGNPVCVCIENRGDRRQIVEGNHMYVLQHTGRNSGVDGSSGGPIGFKIRNIVDFRQIVTAVVPAVYLNDTVFAGERTSGPNDK